jgi:CheY-like chemotaxis protein
MSHEANGKPIELLLIEKNPQEADLVQESLRGGKIWISCHTVSDTDEARTFLEGRGPDGVVRPDLVLYGLNILEDGDAEFLRSMKEDPRVKTIPIVLLSEPGQGQDGFPIQPDGLIHRPFHLDSFLNIIWSIDHFWLRLIAVD